jgi:ribonuclease HI
MLDVYTLHFDGACGPQNPGGTATYGYVLATTADTIDQGVGVVGSGPAMTNNVAEYAGLSAGLQCFLDYWSGDDPAGVLLQVRGDSNLVIMQMRGKWKAKAGLYLEYYRKAKSLASQLQKLGVLLQFDWIPRERNTECDLLSKEAPSLCAGANIQTHE